MSLSRASLKSLVFGLFIALVASAASAQTPTQPSTQTAAKPLPPGMSQAQYDAMIDDIADAVAKKLNGQGTATAAQPTPAITTTKTQSTAGGETMAGGKKMKETGKAVASSWPDYVAALGKIGNALAIERDGVRHGTGWFFTWLIATMVLSLAAEYATRFVINRFRHRLPMTADGLTVARGVAIQALIDAVALIPMYLVIQLLPELWLTDTGSADDLGTTFLDRFVGWRTTVFILLIWFRPGNGITRIVNVDNADAKLIAGMMSLAVFCYAISDSWFGLQVAAGLDGSQLMIAGFIDNVLASLPDLLVIWFTRHATARWFAGLVAPGDGLVTKLKFALARHWMFLGLIFEAIMTVAQAYATMVGNLAVSLGLTNTIQLIVGLLLFESLMDFVDRRSQKPAQTGPLVPNPAILIADCLTFAARVGFVVAMVQVWAVQVLAVVSMDSWHEFQRRALTAGIAIFGAYVVWRLAAFMIDRSLALAPAPAKAGEDDDGPSPQEGASRVRTLLPLFRATIAVVITIMLILVVLSELGVNIAPLIAGASVLGLAISFGSQTLVRDIVSGVFYLVDDAFRVGEYIDTGKQKGTVEGFTLRSVRLRHQNGQVHTIPFGQLGSITNFSRDWTTVKFNLRLARDTDIETVRKVTKKIGQEMMADPELAAEILEPLKMQGVADIADSALIIRFKFTARPSKPSLVQRQAVKRLYQTFGEKGIEFASAAVTVQAAGGIPDPTTIAGAAAAAARSGQNPAPAASS